MRVEVIDARTTAHTDGRTLTFSVSFMNRITDAELQAVIAHECLHVAALHIQREGSRNHGNWNIAADYSVNHVLREAAYQLPAGGLFHTQAGYLSTEQLYDLTEGFSGVGDVGAGEWGVFHHPSTAQSEQEAREMVLDALGDALMIGSVSDSVARIIQESYQGQRDWRDELALFLQGGELRSPSWSRPNRRWIGENVYLPGNGKYGPGKVWFGIDTSDSIDNSLLEKFMGEVRKAIHDLQPEESWVLVCDSHLHHVQCFSPQEIIEFPILGRGWTDFRPIFNWVRDSGVDFKAGVMFTDCQGAWPSLAPDHPVLTVVWPGGGNPPEWSKHIRMS